MKQVWYGISHFSDYGLAHVFLSFEFTNQQYLVLSIEARLQQSDDSYHPIQGLFRQYTKTLVWATEADVIDLRTHIRHEKLYLYPLKLNTLSKQILLLNFVRMTQALNEHAEFYNSLNDNCLTSLLRASPTYNHWQQWLDYRITLPGYSDEWAFEKGLIDTTLDFKSAQKKHVVRIKGYGINDIHFSEKIRSR